MLRDPLSFRYPLRPSTGTFGGAENPRMGGLQDPTQATFGTLARLWPDSI